jgi:hypothetical protein
MKPAAAPIILATMHLTMGAPLNTLKQFVKDLEDWWCIHMHDAPMWPIHGQYQCRTCGRSQIVPWAPPPGRVALHVGRPALRVISPTDYDLAKQA